MINSVPPATGAPDCMEFSVEEDTVIVPFNGVSYLTVKVRKSDFGMFGCTGLPAEFSPNTFNIGRFIPSGSNDQTSVSSHPSKAFPLPCVKLVK